jgi:hypothetical protein
MDEDKLLKTFKLLLKIEDIEIIKYVLESLIEELEDINNQDNKI